MSFYLDVAERAIKTFIQVAITMVVATGISDLDVSVIETIALGAGSAALSVISSALSAKWGEPTSASLVSNR